MLRLTGMSKEEFAKYLPDLVLDATIRTGKQRAVFFTNLMETARAYELEKEAEAIAGSVCLKHGVPELWELPKTFEKGQALPPFPLDALPQMLKDFVKAVSDHVQVYPEMAVLPLLSVLSLCVQGKAVICYPGNNHTEPLNLYTLTVAAPGERKSGCLRELMRPVQHYQERWNETHRSIIAQYRTEKAFLEQKKAEAMRGKNADMNKAKEYTQKLLELEQVSEMKLTVKDTTPEALAAELYLHGERMGIIDDEGSVFDVIAGIYSNGQSNLNIFLEAYDGSPYSISRATKEDIMLHEPLLTLGLMVQPSHFAEAMSNKQFSGRGFIHRFLFSFPQSRSGSLRFESPNIPIDLQKKYDDLICILLSIPQPDDPPVIIHSQGSRLLFREYFDRLQESVQPGGKLEDIKEWTAKHLSRALRVAGIFHVAVHKEKAFTKSIDVDTARSAIAVARWCEAQAAAALIGSESEAVTEAKGIVEKLKRLGKSEVTRSELINSFRNMHAGDLALVLELLESRKYIKINEIATGKKGRTKQIIKVNPLLLDR